jgi:hypothetical protein
VRAARSSSTSPDSRTNPNSAAAAYSGTTKIRTASGSPSIRGRPTTANRSTPSIASAAPNSSHEVGADTVSNSRPPRSPGRPATQSAPKKAKGR